VGGSTDAPYARPDVWAAVEAATKRRTKTGALLGSAERISTRGALAMFQGPFDDPGGAVRSIAMGQPADFALLRDSYESIAADDFAEPVAATIVAGTIVWSAERLA
jgi:predicted amidohydrolase YtcJ